MPLRTSVAISRKVGDNHYGSHAASVSLEVELDSALIQDPERFHDRIRQVFRLAQRAVDDELARYQSGNGKVPMTNGVANGRATAPSHAKDHGNGSNGHRTGNGQSASERQMAYARQLAGQIEGLGVRKLETLATKMFAKPLAALTSLDASGLIATLKGIKAGAIDLEAALEGGNP